eukprot:TRINITY_DN533_c0_g1_i5.p1 TRINITY_DN533_c0_g1~~TRINITY_DN533_c0_g1_i5.p1  ORF type:complete len:214 (-),score=58.72 TRINITY_DN533_c0_g1_i5:139-780(-)
MNSKNFHPLWSGLRMLIATQWVIIHYCLAKSNAISTGISFFAAADHASWSKFYPSMLKPATESIQSVLPMRLKAGYAVDPPVVFFCLWKIASLWVSKKIVKRLNVLRYSDLPDYIDNSAIPSFMKGDLDESALIEEWIPLLKDFYENSLQPVWTKMTEGQEKVEVNFDHWNGTHEKDHKGKKEKKEKKEKKKKEKKEKKEKKDKHHKTHKRDE